MSTIEVTFTQFKRMTKEFIDALPTATVEEAEAGLKCVQLAYLGMIEDDPRMFDGERLQSQYVLQIVTDLYIKHAASRGQ